MDVITLKLANPRNHQKNITCYWPWGQPLHVSACTSGRLKRLLLPLLLLLLLFLWESFSTLSESFWVFSLPFLSHRNSQRDFPHGSGFGLCGLRHWSGHRGCCSGSWGNNPRCTVGAPVVLSCLFSFLLNFPEFSKMYFCTILYLISINIHSLSLDIKFDMSWRYFVSFHQTFLVTNWPTCFTETSSDDQLQVMASLFQHPMCMLSCDVQNTNALLKLIQLDDRNLLWICTLE